MPNLRWSSFFWVFFLFLLQNSLNYIFPGFVPNCILIGVLYYSLLDGPFAGMLIGAFGGFFLDLLGTGSLGFSMMTYSVSGALAGFVSTRIFRESLMTEIFLPSLFYYGITVAEVISVKSRSGEAVEAVVLLEAFLIWPIVATMVASPILFSMMGNKRSSNRRRSTYTFR